MALEDESGWMLFNETLMDEEIVIVTKKRKWQRVGWLMGLCVKVFVCCKLMKIGSYVFWVAKGMLWQQRSGLICCDTIDEFLLWQNL
jgi:hypothetical protein